MCSTTGTAVCEASCSTCMGACNASLGEVTVTSVGQENDACIHTFYSKVQGRIKKRATTGATTTAPSNSAAASSSPSLFRFKLYPMTASTVPFQFHLNKEME